MTTNSFNVTLDGSFAVSTGGTLGTTGAVNSGSALPVGTATHWKLSAPIGGPIAFSVDAVVPQSSVTAFTLLDGNSTTAPDGYSVVGSVTTWSWSSGHFDSGGGWGTGVPLDGTVTVMTFLAPSILQATPTVEGSLVDLSWATTIGTGPNAGAYTAMNVIRNGVQIASLDPSTVSYVDSSIMLGESFTYEIQGPYTNVSFPLVVSNDETVCVDSFNCDCESVSTYDTLVNVRTKMLIRLGYPNQSANPPPGMATLIDQFLRDAQDEIYRQLQRAALRTERFFRWTMVPGQRYYGLTENDNCCDAVLDPYKITWVGFEDLNAAWYRLDEGIPPEYYTRANINFGWPTRFEIRSCIEIFPAPQAAYTLWIKGDFGLAPLVADSDHFTIDDKMVFLLALGNAKAHYGQKDAQLVLSQAGNYTRAIVAGSHGTRRYVPRSEVLSPLTPPKFLPLGSDQA